MLSSVLIANRGEIAVRIIRTARSLGMRTIAVYSQADAGALHVELADEAHEIGPAAAAESYLNGERILKVAKACKAACIHPGYGFLAENAEFAAACEKAGIVFVGPTSSAIRAMGRKDEAKALMEKAGVPVVPGYYGDKQDTKFLRQKAYETGYPLLIKAVAGGGGKGMRRVDKHGDFDAALESAQREGKAAFGNARVLIEKYVASPRHVEIQVFADAHGNAMHLFERDCSLQRRHQKIIEEAPAPGMTEKVRDAMGAAALKAAKAVDYRGAGTVEFIADGSKGLRADGFYFMEMNTRLQVEHPVTEAITGLDLVEWQFRVAAGEQLPLAQNEIAIDGHAVEARIYAEDPAHHFLPSTGRLAALEIPEEDGIRIDAGVRAGDTVLPHYDPMIAKVVAHGSDRMEALDRLASTLRGSVIAGPRTNAAFAVALVENKDFRAGKFDTGLIDRNLDALIAVDADTRAAVAALGALRILERENARLGNAAGGPWDDADAWQMSGHRTRGIDMLVDGTPERLELIWEDGAPAISFSADARERSDVEAALVDTGDGVFVVVGGQQFLVRRPDYDNTDFEALDGDTVVRAPMHGKVLALYVAAGDEVERGDRIAIVEAMKMEHAVIATRAGTVNEVAVGEGDQVGEGDRLAVIHGED